MCATKLMHVYIYNNHVYSNFHKRITYTQVYNVGV